MSLRRVPALLPVALVADAAMAIVHHGAALEPTAWAYGAGLAALATRIVALCALATTADGLAATLAPRPARSARAARAIFGVAAAIEITHALFAFWLAPREMIDLGGPAWRTLLLGREIGLPLGLAVLATTGVLRRPLVGGAAFALLGFLIALAAVPRAIGPMMPALPVHQGLLLLAVVQAIAGALVVAMVAVAPHREAPPHRRDVRAGLGRASSALFARVVIAAGTLPVAALAGLAGARGSAFLGAALPAAAAMATAALAVGLARASVWAEDGAPRVRFALAATVLGATAVLEMIVLVLVYRGAGGHHDPMAAVAVQTVEWAAPAAEVAGILIVASALAASARVAGAEGIARQVPALALALVACLGTSGSLVQPWPGLDRGTWLLLSIGAAVTTAIATFGLARLTDAVAAALHGRDGGDGEVPSAVVRGARP